MKLNINDVVRLLDGLPGGVLMKGSIGTIVAVFSEPEEAFEIEFCDKNGAMLAQVTLRRHQVSLVN